MRLPGYNAYRKLTGRSPTRDFAEISDDKEVCSRLKEVYKTVDRVEFYPGLFAEPVRTNAALPLLAAELVAVYVLAGVDRPAALGPSLQRANVHEGRDGGDQVRRPA